MSMTKHMMTYVFFLAEQPTAAGQKVTFVEHFLLTPVQHDLCKMVCKRDGPCTTSIVSVEPAGMSAFVCIVLFGL